MSHAPRIVSTRGPLQTRRRMIPGPQTIPGPPRLASSPHTSTISMKRSSRSARGSTTACLRASARRKRRSSDGWSTTGRPGSFRTRPVRMLGLLSREARLGFESIALSLRRTGVRIGRRDARTNEQYCIIAPLHKQPRIEAGCDHQSTVTSIEATVPMASAEELSSEPHASNATARGRRKLRQYINFFGATSRT